MHRVLMNDVPAILVLTTWGCFKICHINLSSSTVQTLTPSVNREGKCLESVDSDILPGWLVVARGLY